MELAAQAHSIMAQQQLEHEVTARWNVYQATRAQYDHFDKTMMTDMAAAAALAERQYRQGAIDVQLYLETQRAWLNARKIYDEVLLDLWNLRLDLELLTGGKGLPQPVSETKKKQETGKLK
jgi:cobalt-zinc-cadmium efflux system outer membrane protein